MSETVFICGSYFGGNLEQDSIADQERVVDKWLLIGILDDKEKALESCNNPGDFWLEVPLNEASPSGKPEEILDLVEDYDFPYGYRENTDFPERE